MRVPIPQSVFVLLIGLTFFTSIFAGQSDNKFLQTRWTTDQGLPQNSVTSIAQTPDGYLWIGTFGGLARFDGVRFKIYTTSNTPELKSNRITAMTTDKTGMLWIGTERGEIICYESGKFRLIDNGEGFKNNPINDIFADDTGILWMSGWQGFQLCTAQGCREKDFQGAINKIRKDSDGNIWMVSKEKLYKYKNGEFVPDEVLTNNVINLETNPKGGLWIVKFFELGQYSNGKYETLTKFKSDSSSSALFNSPDGALWFNISDELYQIKDGNIKNYKVENITKNTANLVLVDRENNIWLGRIGDGLVRLMNRRIQTLTKENGFSEIPATSIAEDPNGAVWIASAPSLYRWQNDKIEQVTAVSKENLARGSLLFDSAGTLWNSTSAGLQSFRDGKFIFRKDISWNDAQSANSLFEDSKKNLWYGQRGVGVIESDREKIIARYSTENGLVGNVVDLITETHDGAMWFGTTSGLSRLKDGKFTNYTTKDGLSNDYVRDIYEDIDGTLWIGTYGGGLNQFKNGKFTPITTKDGLFDDIVSRILIDDDDNFWMLGNRGIYSANRKMLNDFVDGKAKQIYCTAYTVADGMITSEGNGGYQSAGTRTRDEKLWFPMINSVVIIDPKQEKIPPPQPMIEEIFLNGREVDGAKKVEINPGSESLEINYTGLSFRKPEQIHFCYRLEGLDKNWTEAGTRRLANYPYLPSGNYRFQLSAANADGVWSEQIAEFEIEVYPPFWKTWWFMGLILLVCFGLFAAIYQYRVWQFAKTKAIQEEYTRKLLNAQESERHRIAAEIHDSLGQQLLIIKNWAAYCLGKTSSRSKIRQQIAQINDTAEQAISDVRLIAKTLSPYHLDKAGLTNTIRFMVKQVAESSNINFITQIDDIDGILSKEAEINLYRIVQEAVNNIIKHSNATDAKVTLLKDADDLKLTIFDNGKGFLQTAPDLQKFGIGLNGMAKRAQMLGSELFVQSSPNDGTLIVIEIELNRGKKYI